MKQTIVLLIFGGALALLLSSYATGAAANGRGNLTGATGTSGCSCHGSTSSIGTTVQLDSAGTLVTTYYPGVAYTVKISATNATGATLKDFGFQLSVVKATGAGTSSAALAGTWGTLPDSTHITATGSCDVVEHSDPLAPYSGTGGAGTIYYRSIPWTSPVAGTGSVKIYGVINAVNDNGSDNGDYNQVATAVTITETTVTAPVASVSIALTSGTNPTCAGTSVTFTATPTNGGTTPAYQWKVNGTNVGTNSATYTTTTLATGSVVTCTMTSNLSGVTGSPATSNSITMTIDPTVVPSVSISTPNQTICAGTSVTFTATPTNGGTPTYQWKVNGTNVGTNSATYTTTTLTNGQIVTCTMTSTVACASPTSATSNSLTMTVDPVLVPSVSISTASQTVCSGSSVTFTATPTNGGTTPSYQWQVNGTNVGTNSATYTTTTLTTGAIVTCTMTSTATCASPTTATSNSLTMTVSGSVTPSVSISTPSTSVCPGASVTFTATPANGGTTPSYQWKVNGTNVGTNSATYTTTTLTNGAIVTCIMTSNSPCASPATATSNSITMSVATQTPTVSITAGSMSICSGTANTFTAIITNGGTNPSYQWKVNGTNAGSNSSTFISSSLANNAVVSCTMTSSLACASPTSASSNSITITVTPTVTPAVFVVASHNTICQGEVDSFIATGTNLGSTPTYQWLVNGANAGGNSPVFISSSLANGSTVTCYVTSDAACPLPALDSSTATITVTAAPSVAITPSGNLILCLGDSLLLTASGATTYLWTNEDTGAHIWIHQTDTVNVTGSNGSCPATAPTPATVVVHAPSVASISKSGNILTASIEDTYQWLLNGNILPGDTSRTLAITQSGNYAVMTEDVNGCYATSNTDSFTYADGITSISTDLGVKVYPVPNQGSFVVEARDISAADLVIYDIYGQRLYQQTLSADHTQVRADLAPAIYFVTVSEGDRTETIKMQVTRE